jgi:hypothetical protein
MTRKRAGLTVKTDDGGRVLCGRCAEQLGQMVSTDDGYSAVHDPQPGCRIPMLDLGFELGKTDVLSRTKRASSARRRGTTPLRSWRQKVGEWDAEAGFETGNALADGDIEQWPARPPDGLIPSPRLSIECPACGVHQKLPDFDWPFPAEHALIPDVTPGVPPLAGGDPIYFWWIADDRSPWIIPPKVLRS